MVLRGVRHESEVLMRQVSGRLTTLRAHRGPLGDIEHAEEIADKLRRLVTQTTRSSAADRARVRAAVQYFAGLRNTRSRRPQRSLAEELHVVDTMVGDLRGRDITWS
jgi:hypothetical protein